MIVTVLGRKRVIYTRLPNLITPDEGRSNYTTIDSTDLVHRPRALEVTDVSLLGELHLIKDVDPAGER